METDTKKKRRPGRPSGSPKQRTAIKYWLVNGGTLKAAMAHAGYTETMQDNPQKVFKDEVYTSILNAYGLDDESLADAHHDLVHATTTKEKEFYGKPIFRKTKKGNHIASYQIVPDELIKEIIESSSGCKLISIIDYGDKKIAYYNAPERIAKKSGVELAYKTKGHMAPEPHDFTFKVATDSEKEKIKNILNQNK